MENKYGQAYLESERVKDDLTKRDRLLHTLNNLQDPGWEERHQIYTLYHYLNHYNLFGGGYRSQCLSILRNLVG